MKTKSIIGIAVALLAIHTMAMGQRGQVLKKIRSHEVFQFVFGQQNSIELGFFQLAPPSIIKQYTSKGIMLLPGEIT